jgi:hypothetical protein
MSTEYVTDVAAACAATSTLWLGNFNNEAQLVLTVLGILWLLIQIYFKLGPHIHKFYLKLFKRL